MVIQKGSVASCVRVSMSFSFFFLSLPLKTFLRSFCLSWELSLHFVCEARACAARYTTYCLSVSGFRPEGKGKLKQTAKSAIASIDLGSKYLWCGRWTLACERKVLTLLCCDWRTPRTAEATGDLLSTVTTLSSI